MSVLFVFLSVAGHWFSKRYAAASGELPFWSPLAKYRISPKMTDLRHYRLLQRIGVLAFVQCLNLLSTWFAILKHKNNTPKQ